MNPHDLPALSGAAPAYEALARASVLYTDLDGTLVAPGGSVLADATGAPSAIVASAIVAVNAAGLEVVPVSGRNRMQLMELARLLGWGGFIAEAGAIIQRGTGADAAITYDRGVWTAEQAGGRPPFATIRSSGAYEALAEAFPGRVEHYASWQMDREATLLLRGCLDLAAAQAVLDSIDPPLDIVDNGMLRNPGTLACGDLPPHAYHVVPRGVCKARAIALDLEARGLGPADAIAIGDSATDIQMAEATGALFLVDNAFASRGVIDELARGGRPNIFRLSGARGEGWAELASAWVQAVHA